MVDRHDRLRHSRVAQHASIWRERSQQISDAPTTFGQAEPSTSGARASPQVTPPSSSRKRRDSPSNVSLPPSSRRHQDSPVQPLTDDVVVPAPPPIDDVADLVPPPKGEDDVDVEPEAFGGGPFDLSLLPMYLDHTARHIWDREVSLVGFFSFFT